MDIRDIAEERYRQELVNRYGRLAVPTIVIGKRKFLGFTENKADIQRLITS